MYVVVRKKNKERIIWQVVREIDVVKIKYFVILYLNLINIDVLYSYKQVYYEFRYCILLFCVCRIVFYRYGSLSEKVMDFGNCFLVIIYVIMVERKQQVKEIEEKEQDKIVVIDGLYILGLFKYFFIERQ